MGREHGAAGAGGTGLCVFAALFTEIAPHARRSGRAGINVMRGSVLRRSACALRRLGQGLRRAARAPAADHLGGTFLLGRAVHDAIGAGAALAVGAAAIALGVLREPAAGLDADASELVGAGLGQGEVAPERRAAKRQDAGQHQQSGQMSHGSLPSAAPPPDRLCHSLRAGEAGCQCVDSTHEARLIGSRTWLVAMPVSVAIIDGGRCWAR